jgi:hypothetical protein
VKRLWWPFVALLQVLAAAWALLLIMALLASLAVLAIHDAVARRRTVRVWSSGGRQS